VISNCRDGVGSNLVANLGGRVDHRLDNWNMSNSPNSGKCSWSSKWSGVGEDSTVQEDLRVSLSLLPLGNDGLLSSSGSSEHGETMVSQGMGGISSVGQGVGGVSDVREDWRVVDERSGGRHHTAGSSEDGGLSISRPLSITVTTIRVTIISSVSSVSVSSITVITVVGISISLWLGVSRSLAVVTKVSESVISNSDSDRVSGHFVLNLGGRDHIGLDNWNMSNSPNSGPNVGQRSSSSVGQTSAIQELWVSLSGGEGEESGCQESFDHGACCEESEGPG